MLTQVLTLLDGWLRDQHQASAGGAEWRQQPARDQVIDFMTRLERIKRQVAEMGLDPSVAHRTSDGVLYIGGPDGIIIGCTDASAYLSDPDPTPTPTPTPTSTSTSSSLASASAAPTPAGGTSGPPHADTGVIGAEATAVDSSAPAPMSTGRVVGRYSAWLSQTDIMMNNSKFFRLQLIGTGTRGVGIYLWCRWGRVGENGAGNASGPYSDEATAIKEFEKKFKAKTGGKWAERGVGQGRPGKYTFIGH